jgi:ALfa-l-rhamnosidase|nr:MAG TPA: Flagellar and Swarming motility protein [Caudoviricetes sp.]
MIFLREIKSEPLFISSENVEDYEMHKSGFGTVVIDKNGFAHHVMESLEEVEDVLAKGNNVTVNYKIGIGNRVSPEILSIAKPNNVPSRVRPIVIFPNVDYKDLTIDVTQRDSKYNNTTFKTVIEDNQSHVINLNTGVE